MKTLNKYFSIVMIFVIFLTFSTFQFRKKQFINNSIEHVLVIDKLSKQETNSLINKLKNLTFQDVQIKEENEKTIITMMCPPEKMISIRKKIKTFSKSL